MVRVEDLNITFFHLPKNAGSSIATWLTDNVNGEEYIDDFRHASPKSLKPMFNDFGWSFCCVRNPWDRTVSWYNFFKGQGKMPISFEEYMDRITRGETSAKYIVPIKGQVQFAKNVDYVIRYENLLEDFKVVQDKVNCHVALMHTNKSKRTRYIDYYAKDEHINWIGESCADEIAEFNYSFGG